MFTSLTLDGKIIECYMWMVREQLIDLLSGVFSAQSNSGSSSGCMWFD